MNRLSVKSMTSGRELPATKLKESSWRKFFLLPHVQLLVNTTSLGAGHTGSKGWYRPNEIIGFDEFNNREDYELILLDKAMRLSADKKISSADLDSFQHVLNKIIIESKA